jgi:dTDP-4-amino-4,6-dideoxygalactose transaminase
VPVPHHLADWNERRRRHAATYTRLLAGRDDLIRPVDRPDREPVYHLYVLRHPDRDAILARLHDHGIGAGIHYPFPVHRLGAYRHVARPGTAFPEAEAWAAECFSLPLYPELDEDSIAYVVRHI